MSAPTLADTKIDKESILSSAEGEANFETALSAYTSGHIEEALRLGKIASRAGSSEAGVLVGHILSQGETGRIDKTEARKWYEKAALKGHPDALVALGEMGIRNQGGVTPFEAVSYLTRAADGGRTDAMRALADMYRTGQGVKANKAQQQFWLRKAAESFDTKGARALGDSLYETNPKEALKAYEIAAAAGDIEAAYIAGIMYVENYDIRPDEQKSADWLKIAAEGGHAAAMADYGLLVYQGVGAERSEEKAASWFKKSAEAGDSEGQFLYAFTLAKGEGVKQNFEEAYYWVLMSIKSTDDTSVDNYNKDKQTLKTRLEGNVSDEILERARKRMKA